MATVNYSIKSKISPANIYVRYANGRNVSFETPIGIFVNVEHWDKKNQKIRNLIAIPNRDKINTKLAHLKIHILYKYNLDFMEGEIIDRIWLKETIKTFFSRPKEEEQGKNLDHKIYLSSYADWWMENKSATWKVKAGKYMADRDKAHYRIAIKDLKEYEGKSKLRLKNVDSDALDSLCEFLESKDYRKSTISKKIDRIKFFCARAENDNLEINKGYKSKVFVSENAVEFLEPYFNEEEINEIYKYDFSYSDRLDNARDNLIIGLRTGLRVSDFLRRLNIENFKDGFIEIKTKKTDTFVTLPIHNQVKAIINKRKGNLPNKISDQHFNEYIKEISFICNFDNEMVGGISQNVLKDGKPVIEKGKAVIRKVVGKYPKHLLVTSHICRRSFATNAFGTIPNISLCALGGWSNEAMMLKYIKKSGQEHAEALAKAWNK